MTDVAGLVAGRLRPLRPALHPDELARRRHVPHRRRPRRWRRRHPALRPPQQLARQREPRQGPPAAVAGQAEVRAEDLLGRPPGLHRQRRPGVDGLQDLRLRLRPRGRLGARGDLLGAGGHLARRRALQRRPGARRPLRRRADGPDLREPGGPQRKPGSSGVRAGHPGDLPPDGDERRGDRRADRRRPHVRQVPRRGRRRAWSAPSPRAAPSNIHGPRLEERRSAAARARTRSPAASRARGRRPRSTWDNSYFETLFGHEWELTSSPAGAQQWKPKDGAGADAVPDRARPLGPGTPR